jgi:hypothetical protein
MNPIDKFFNQLKYYMKRDLIKKSIRKSIKYIKSSLIKTKEYIKEIKMKYRIFPKVYKE